MTSHPPVSHFFVHRAFICAAVNSNTFLIYFCERLYSTVHKSRPYYLFILNHCQIGKVMSRIFWKKSTAPFSKTSCSYMNKQPTDQNLNSFSMRKRCEKTLTRYSDMCCVINLVPVFYFAHSISPDDHGDERPSQIPHSREDKFDQMPHICPASPLGLNTDRCIILRLYLLTGIHVSSTNCDSGIQPTHLG